MNNKMEKFTGIMPCFCDSNVNVASRFYIRFRNETIRALYSLCSDYGVYKFFALKRSRKRLSNTLKLLKEVSFHVLQ